MSRELMPKSGIMMPHVVINRDAAVVGVSTVDGVAGAVDLTDKYLQKTDAAATYQTKTEGASKTYVLDSIQPIMEGALFKADPFVDNNIPFRSAGANGVESVDMIKVTPENSIKLGSYESSVQGVEIHSAGRVVVVDKNDAGVETKYPVYSKRFRPEIEDLPFAAIGSYVKDSKGRTVGVTRTGINSDIKQLTQKVTFTQPISVADAVDATNAVNLGQISSDQGASLIGLTNGTVADVSQFVTPEQFYANHPGETDWAVMIQDAYDYAYANNKTVLLANHYVVKSTIKHLAGLSVLQTGVLIADPTGDFTTSDAAGNSYSAVYHIMSEGATYSNKRTYIPRIHIRHSAAADWGIIYYPHVDAIGVLMTHIAGVTVGQMETWGMLRGGANIGGIPKSGYEIAILKSCFGIMRWTDASTVGLDIRVGDSFFAAPVCIDYPIGIQIDGSGANTLVDPHPWGHPKTADNLYPNRQMLIGFHIVNGGNTLYRPYADTVSKLNPDVGSTMENGGYGFVIRSSKNVITDAIVSSHPQQVVTGGFPFFAVYFVGSVSGNKFELRDLQQKSTHFSIQPITWDDVTYPTIPFRNKWIGLRSELQKNIALGGNITINGTGITQSGTYTLRQIADDVHLTCEVTVTAAEATSTDNLTITLPRGMGFYPGAMMEIEDRSAISKGLTIPTCRVLGVVLPGDFTKIVLYAERADGTRFDLNSTHTQVGTLKFRIIGRLSNGI